MKPNPEILFKYRSLSGDNFNFTRDIFIKNELYFPHPDEINDPFDCKVPPYLENLTRADLLEFNRTSGLAAQKKDIIEKRIKNSPLPQIVEGLKQKTKDHIQVGVLSFSQHNSDILMWGHYADSHKGICIGFDYHELYSTFRTVGLIIFGDVQYSEDNAYPKWNPYDGNTMTQSAKVEAEIKKVYFTKSRHWKYEQEWRVVIPEAGRSWQKINPNALVSVHLGCQIAKGHKESIINWCLQREQKPKLYEMIKDKSSYSLRESEILY